MPGPDRGVEGATKKELLSNAVDKGDHQNDPKISQSRVAEDVFSEARERGDSADHESADNEQCGKQQPRHDWCDDRTSERAATQDVAQMQRPRKQTAERPGCCQAEGQRVEGRTALSYRERQAEQCRADGQGDPNDDPAA